MMIPDYALIAEIMLYAEGFDTARSLAQKMVQLFRLSSEQLSKQDHYDFGMRAVKSILVCAGALKRDEPNLPEDILLIRAMKDSNVPKFLKNDVILFENMIQDLFPGKVVGAQNMGPLQRAIELQLTKKKYQVIPSQVTKILQVQATMQVRHGVMLVGRPGTGKTVAHKVLAESLSKLSEAGYENEYFVKVVPHILNPKSIRMEELYGDVHELTKDWHDGLIANMARTAVKDTSQNHWIVFDGPVDSLWIENMNTVLDDNRMLCLTNGERIKLPTSVRLCFEVLDLAVASPATVSRCGMVYFEEENVDMVWKPILKSWIDFKHAREHTNLIEKFANKAIEPSLQFIRKECEELVPSLDSNLVQSFLALLEGLFKPDYGVDFETGLYYPPEKPVEEKEEDGELGDEELEQEAEIDEDEEEEEQEAKKTIQDVVKYDQQRISAMFDRIDEWNFDVFTLNELCHGHSLLVTGYTLFVKYDLLAKYNVPEKVMIEFLKEIEYGYHDNPYHNSLHACDVMQVLHVIINRGGLRGFIKSHSEVFGALVAAIIHDFDHPGLNNPFQINSSSYLALLYNDRSVLENHHVAHTFDLMRQKKYNILAGMDDDLRKSVRELIIGMVLATDMNNHAKYVAKFKMRLDNDADFSSDDDLRLALQIGIKMADVSNPTRPLFIYLRWTEKILEEFFAQGDMEKKMNIPVSPLMDRKHSKVKEGQMAFIKYVILPMFELWKQLCPRMGFSMEYIKLNQRYWETHEAIDPRDFKEQPIDVAMPTKEMA
mmetsp:Transcript_11132/g.16407  ORF Transcript_11132/g.16407 Transcript_11132/m.16407 type:complete len:771 (-) Transcript_11132:42-2354(-)